VPKILKKKNNKGKAHPEADAPKSITKNRESARIGESGLTEKKGGKDHGNKSRVEGGVPSLFKRELFCR